MNTEKTFEQKEAESRETFLQFTENNIGFKIRYFEEDPYAKWDVKYYMNKIPTIGEIKLRHNNVDDYSTYWIEPYKIYALRNEQQRVYNTYGHRPKITFINHFDDGITLIWDLDKINITKLDASLEFTNKTNSTYECKYKIMLHLPVSAATIYSKIKLNKL